MVSTYVFTGDPIRLSTEKHQTLANDMSQVLAKLSNKLELSATNHSSKQKSALAAVDQIKATVDARVDPNGSNTLAIDEVAIISKQLASISKQISTPELKKLTRGLADHLFADWLSQARDHVEASIYKQIKPLGEVGASNVKSVKAEIKGGGAIGAAQLTGSIGIDYKDILDADDEGLFFRTKIYTGTAGLSAGGNIGIAKLGGKLGASGSLLTFEEYNNVKAYVHMEAHNLTSLKRGDKLPSDIELKETAKSSAWHSFARFVSNLMPGHPGSELKFYQKQLQKAVNNQHELNSLINDQLGLPTKVVATPPQLPETLRGYIFKGGGNAGLSGSVGIPSTQLSASAGIQISHDKTEIYEFVPSYFWQTIQKNADRINELPDNLLKYGRQILAFEGSPLNALETLENEFKTYITTVQKYDGGDKSLRSVKHDTESRWGANGRHELLRAMHASFALFGAELQKADTEDTSVKAAKTKMEEMARDLESPPIEHSRKKLEDIASLKQLIRLSITDTKAAFNVSAGPASLGVSFLQRNRVHPSRLRQGDYRDVEFKIQGTLTPQNIKEIVDSATPELEKIEPGLVDPATLKEQISDFALNNMELAGGGSLRIMMRFFKPEYQKELGDNTYHHQLTRVLLDKSVAVGVGGSLPTVGATVGGKIGASYTQTRVLKEWVGDDTLSYVMTRHNRFFRNGETKEKGEWQEFLSKHESAINTLLGKLGNPETTVYKEAQHWLDDILKNSTSITTSDAITLKTKFNKAMLDVHKNPHSAMKLDGAKKVFGEFLAEQVSPWWANHQSNWTTLHYTDISKWTDHIKNSVSTRLKNIGSMVCMAGRSIKQTCTSMNAKHLFTKQVGVDLELNKHNEVSNTVEPVVLMSYSRHPMASLRV